MILRLWSKDPPFSFIQIPARSEAYRMAYFPIVVLNLLPAGVVTAPTLETFKGGLIGPRP